MLIGALAFAIVIGGGVAAWAEVSSSSAGYRMATVTRADIADTLTVVGSVAPVSQAAASFQVAGKVTSVAVTPGAQVTAGQTLGTLDSTALSETVASDESALNADEAKLAEDEANQSASGSGSNTSSGAKSTTTTTTTPSNGGSGSNGGQGNTNSPTVTKDQDTLTQDEEALSKAQQQEAADLAQAQTDCTSANTSTPSGQAACESALQTVSADEQKVSTDQSTVSKDETALAQALAAESSGGSATGSASHAASNQGALAGNTGTSGNSGNGGSDSSPGSGGSGPNSSGNGSSGNSGNTDTPEQIASDQAAIDTAQANLTEAQQSLKEATLTSPISGTVVSVVISAGETVSAGSSTEIITILGTNSYEVEATLDNSQIPSVKVGQTARVEVDGVDGSLDGTVSQVGPVQSSSSGYSYPVIVALPSSSSPDMHSGSSANLTITTGTVSDVVAVPTSAVQSRGSTSYVTELSRGQLTRKRIKVGMVGDTYTQVDSGLSPGQRVVLVDYAEAVPSSNNDTNLSSVLGGGGGAGNFFGGAGGFPVGRGFLHISDAGGGGGKG